MRDSDHVARVQEQNDSLGIRVDALTAPFAFKHQGSHCVAEFVRTK